MKKAASQSKRLMVMNGLTSLILIAALVLFILSTAAESAAGAKALSGQTAILHGLVDNFKL